MFFAPHVKNKRGGNWNILPFPPPCSEEGQKFYKGIFTGVSIEVCDTSDILALYNNGFYGKGSHSRSVPNALIKASQDNTLGVEETLSLGLEEAFFLSYYLKVLQISDLSNKELKWQDLMTAALNINDNFMESLASYLYLKSKGWVVKSGLKFAGNYCKFKRRMIFIMNSVQMFYFSDLP